MRISYLLSIIILTIFLGTAATCYSQDFSNKGRDFWVGYGSHCDMYTGSGTLNTSGGAQEMVLYFATEALTTVTVSIPTIGYTQTYSNIAANTIFETPAIPKSGTNDARLGTEGTLNKGIHITSDQPVVAYAHIYNGARSGATLLFPTNTLGKEYYSLNMSQNSQQAYSYCYFFVVATDTGTTSIQVTPSANTQTMTAGQTYTYNLTQGQVFNALGSITGNSGVDLTGSKIVSIASGTGTCKPIAVYSGSGKINLNCPVNGGGSADNYIVQSFPKTAWGKSYLTVPTYGMPYNYYRIAVSDPTAVVKLNGVILGGLINNFYYQIAATDQPNYIQSDKAIMVAQYITTSGACGNTGVIPSGDGDPEVIYLSSIEQNISKVLLYATPHFAITEHFISVMIPNGGTGESSFRLDGAIPTNSFVVHPQNSNYSYLQQQVSAGAHVLQSDSGFNASAYGYGAVESYGYNAGTNIKDLYQFISIQNLYATVNFPATCKGTPFYFSMVFPYEPAQIQWIFGAALNAMNIRDTTINPPPGTYDSLWVVNGRTLYRYRIAIPYTIITAGTYPIKVIAQNPTPDGCGTEQQIDFDVQVYDPPGADFTFNTNGCTTGPVSFFDNSNTSGRPVISRYWDFGDGNTNGANNPTHVFSGSGAFNVRYSLITDIGCLADTAVHVVTVDEPPVSNFSASNPNCVNRSVSFNDLSTVSGGAIILKWFWDFGDPASGTSNTSALQNPSHTYAATGIYHVTLKVETTIGCQSQVFTLPVTIYANPVADFSFPNICLPVGFAQFTDLSTVSGGSVITAWLWNFGDPASGLSNTSTLQNPTHNYTTSGPYTVSLTVTSTGGCPDMKTHLVNTIYIEPQAAFTNPAEVCLGNAANFSDNSVAAGSTVTQWSWNFGDGGTSTIQNPSHTYAAAGTYTVTLNITSAAGCQAVNNIATHTITVNPLPTANFNYAAPACETKVVNFADVSLANAGTLNGWTWNFDDGSSTSNLQNPTHVYANAGTYTVTLQVTSTKGCISAVFSRQVKVNPQPVPGFISPEVCLSDAFAQFNDTSRIASGSIVTWLWNFDDPGSGSLNTSTLQNPQHRYNSIGTYTASLTVTSNNGCIAAMTQSFTVNGDIPLANFNALSPGALCANDSVAIQNASTVNFGSITKVEIYWDNAGAPATFQTDEIPFPGKIYKHLYPDFQTPLTKIFAIRYKAYSGATCISERTKTITVNAAPKVQFNNIPDICLDAAPYQITQARETGAVPGTGVFGGPGVTPGGIFDPASVGPGTYTILYSFTSATGGCVDTLSKTITVRQPPLADFAFVTPACETEAITFNDNSIASVGTLTAWTWDFADGSPSITRNNGNPFTHVFAAYGTYQVKLKVTTNNGCTSVQKLINVTINPKPKPNFSIPAVACLPNANITFNNLSNIADGTALNYLWNFGDPGSGGVNISTGANPSHSYITTGPFNVNLQVTSAAGCMHDTSIILNTIHPQPLASFSSDKTDVCIGGGFAFNDNSNPMDGSITLWNWTMDDGNARSIPNFIYTYSTTGTYKVSLFIVNSLGCQSTTAFKTVFVNPYPTANAGPDKFVLQGGVVSLTPVLDISIPVTYLWTPPTGLNNPAIPNVTASPQDDITYTLIVTSDKGCQASDQVFVKVLKAPEIPNVFSPNGDGVHDKWEIAYLESYPGCTVDIYNRYGQLVYHSAGYSKPWDGTINGRVVPIGTYYYIVDPKNGRKKVTGYVDIIR